MKTYIALLRGINVSGQKLIKMELLRKVLEELDYQSITTYIQSGNIIFNSKTANPKILEKQIADKIEEHFTFQVPVIIVTPDDLRSVVENNPYHSHKITDPAQPYVAFLSDIPSKEAIESLRAVDFGKDEFVVDNKKVYLLYANSAGNTKLSNAIIENRLKVKATSRNWKTIHKLISLAQTNG